MGYMADRVSGFGTTIFTEMSALAIEHKAINLGQGFPDFAAPDFLKEAAIKAINGDINQYAPANGRPALREAVAAKIERQYGRSYDPNKEILITHGATEAIFATVLGLVNPGEEVIIFEPFYDSYVPSVTIAGGTPRFYTLRPPQWEIVEEELEALFSDKTKLIMLNTPHNPIGKVYSQEELAMISRLCQKYDVIAVSDEVYEHIIFDGKTHYQIAAMPGMAERSVTISSLGKTFSATGWKVGWATASADIIPAIFRAHQFMTFCGAAPLQEATAVALAVPDEFYENLAADYQAKRDYLASALTDAGFPPLPCHGTYFLMIDISHLDFANDVEFCMYLTREVGVVAIPPSAFYSNPADGASLARFTFCKKMETLETAVQRLKKLTQ